jgi:hypothetical protein
MWKHRFLVIAGISLFFLCSISVVVTDTSSASVIAPYASIHCDINTSYLDANPHTLHSIRILDDEIVFDPSFHIDYYWFNFTEEVASYLNNATEQDISTPLLYLRETQFPQGYNKFYPYYPPDIPWTQTQITPIDQTWYLQSYSAGILGNGYSFWSDSWSIVCFCLFIIFLIGGCFFAIQFKKIKRRRDKILFVCMIVLSIISLFILFFLIYCNQMIAS